jgi:copper transport protein
MTGIMQPSSGEPARRTHLTLLLLVLALWLGSIAQVYAHASLIASQPADGALVTEPPANLVLTFNEPVSPRVLQLVTPDGATVPLVAGTAAGATLTVALPSLGDGTHLLSWRVTSADGHPVGGSILFSVGRTGPAPGLSQTASWPIRAGIAVTRFAIYLGLFFGIGGVFFLAWISPLGMTARTAIKTALYLGLAAIGPAFVFQGLDILGAPLSGIVHSGIWQASLDSTYSLTLAVAVVALLLALTILSQASSGPLARPLTAVSLAGAGLALALSGHASTAPPQWLTRPAVLVHGVCVAAWIGSLVPIWSMLRHTDDRQALLRFSTFIPVPFLLLLASGIVLAVIQTRWFADLWHFAYGRILVAKLVLVTALIAIAAVNRLILTRRVVAGAPRARTRLARAVLVEIVLVAGILGLVTLWRFTPPPRALAAAEPAFVHLHDGSTMADLTLTPGRAGAVLAEVRLMREDFSPLPAKEVTLTLSNSAAGIEPIARAGHRREDGTWRVDGLVVPIPGRWEAEIAVLVSDFDRIVLDGPILLQP